ncbi:hypothetical protein K503DRAFT_864580 [Rhizopogon vinicolor AM-OR11-026]|uniref:Uncharacterized protein n=1 Tax=Rhizopogon vinicolor AM-OR11-026 TaxID=1314800 RepID=A0A1B7N6R5_9AGAM|nr:hypothetical protein K503DRAFT_864580 [Rhizopogon vinicolor AM-OR11-026]
MSASPFPEPLDTPMHDFAEFDVPMNSVSQDLYLELSMDHDGHHTAYTNQGGVEVDMETYDDGNVEYEMADETEEFNESHYHHESLDVEVYDAPDAHPPHPIPPDSQSLPSLIVNPEMPLLSSPATFSEPFTPQLGTTPVEHDVSLSHHPVENDLPLVEQPKLSAQQEREDAPFALPLDRPSESDPPHTLTADLTAANSNVSPTVDPHDVEKHPDLLVPETSNEAGSSVQPTQAESILQPQAEEHSETLRCSDVPSEDSAQVQGENPTEVHHEDVDDANDPHEISEGVYIDPPPGVFVSISSSEVPEYCLFNQPPSERGSRSPSAGATESGRVVYSLLLQNRPTLYYEPLSCVFEALRQDDIVAKIPEALEGELVIDAYDLQLSVSEDNIYAHEISLHDMNVLHDGSDFTGPLRIHLRSATPRFILRYRLLQEQISRLDLAAGAVEESPEEGYDRAKQHDGGQEPDHYDKKAQHEASPRDGQKDVDETEGVHQPEVHPEQPQDEEAAAIDTTFIPQAVENSAYHHVGSEASQALEDEGDYEGTSASTEYQEEAESVLDAAAVHETADTDATALINDNSQFGGEETEYSDYVQPEEYDERYGEDFSEYDQTVGYGETVEQDASTAVDESQAVLPGSDLYEAETTPVPSAQLIDSTTAQRLESADSDSHEPLEQGGRLPSYESFEKKINQHTDKVLIVDQQTDQHESILQLPIDESDSNFLAMLEREADSELDHSSSSSNAKPTENGALDEVWDEWDDELDADGEADEEWLDPGDSVSNESSVTLSSSSSGKRGHDEVDPEEGELETGTRQGSPDKRPRIH